MMQDVKISIGEAASDGRGHVVIKRQFTYPDGRVEDGVYIFPEDALEWRIAEYDLDPDDLDSVLEIVLAECHMDPLPDDETHYLFTAETVEDARALHLERCGEVWRKHFPRDARGGRDRHVPVTQDWKDLFVVHAEATSLKKQLVNQHRDKIRKNRESGRPSDVSRVERLRRELKGDQGGNLHH